jgi:ABC-type Fe3+/spermidine/putrescine transport system ATPase subunit
VPAAEEPAVRLPFSRAWMQIPAQTEARLDAPAGPTAWTDPPTTPAEDIRVWAPPTARGPIGGEVVLRLENVSKLFGNVRAVDSATLEVRRGETFTLLGPSGCGKTTTLRLVAGLERPDAGEIVLRDRIVASVPRRIWVPPHKRNLGMVFQSYAIWPHMTVFENVAYPLRLRRLRSGEIKERVARVLELVGLTGLEGRPATLLSGGQMQRLALCRALVYEPDLLLLDEPFSNLDAKLREQMRVELKLLQRRLGITVLFVTHDQIEALSLSERVAVMHNGVVEQVGPPRSLYERPASPFVRDFLGQTVILRGRTTATATDGAVTVKLDGLAPTDTLAGRLAAGTHLEPGAPAHLAVRPEDIRVEPADRPAAPAAGNVLTGTIDALLFIGDRYEARVGIGEGPHQRVLLYLPRGEAWREGQRLRLTFPPEVVSVWPA